MFDRALTSALQPRTTLFRNERQHSADLDGVSDMEFRGAFFGPDLDADIWPSERVKCIFVGNVVTEIEHSGRTDLAPQPVEGKPLRSLDGSDLSDHFSVATRQPKSFGQLACKRLDLVRVIGAVSVVDRHAGRFGFDANTRPLRAKRPGQAANFRKGFGPFRRQGTSKTKVKLTAVRAHQANLVGQPSQKGQVPKRPPRNDRHVSLSQFGEGPNGNDTLTRWPSVHWVGDDRRQRAIEICRNQQHRCGCERL